MSAFCDASDITVTRPVRWQVVQRDVSNTGVVSISGVCKVPASIIEARFVLMPKGDGKSTDWQRIVFSSNDGNFQGKIPVTAGGWYILEIRAMKENVEVAGCRVEDVGVGEVFVTAGQSNSANYGSERLKPAEDRVVAYGDGKWQPAEDPMPGGRGEGGSPWCPLGNMLVRSLKMPVGFAVVGYHGSTVSNWMPVGEAYPRIQNVIKELRETGVRAVLWHQGEADNGEKTTIGRYYQGMKTIIESVAKDAGYKVPWFVARASFIPERYNPPNTISEAVRQAQTRLWKDGIALQGPDTDDLTGPRYRCDDEIHFNGYGHVTHAQRWFAMLWSQLFAKES